MMIPDWVWVVAGFSLLLLGLQLGVTLGRAGERARQAEPDTPAPLLPKAGMPSDNPVPPPKVNWSSINLDLSAPSKDDHS